MVKNDNKKDFVKNIAKKLERPPYFRKMEKYNLEGSPKLEHLPRPEALSSEEFSKKAKNSIVLDTRKELGFGNGHIPNSISIWKEGLPAFAGWFLPYDKPILLVTEENNTEQVVRYLVRIGYDNIVGYLSKDMLGWHMDGKDSETIETITVPEFCNIIEREESPYILDVRNEEEVKEQEIQQATHIPLTRLENNYKKIPKDEKIYIICGSGLRSMTAASLLKREGWGALVVVSGGTSGEKPSTCGF